jgi:FAD/FMN-containing dehydrogenase
MITAKINHLQKIKQISTILKNRKSTVPITFIKKSVSHQVPKPQLEKNKDAEKNEAIDLSDLNEILEIDLKNKTCTAEPGVTFSDLIKKTLKYNLVPLTVPELKTITIGGAVAGCSVESMSYKYSGFHDSCLEYEIITASGKVLNCTPTNENKNLFQMTHGTFGTLGIITKLKFKLISAQPFVKMNYETYSDLELYQQAIWRHYQKKDIDFMDGIIHSSKKFVLCLGTFVDTAPYTHNYDWLRIFYKSTAKRKEDYLTAYDYFFRYDSGCHWISRNYGLDNLLLRFLLGKFFLPSTKMLTLAKKLQFIFKHLQPDVVVDIFVPFSRWKKFFSFYLHQFNYFPLWIVPYQMPKPAYPWINPQHLRGIKDRLFIDLAIYGMKQKNEANYYHLMEKELKKVHGLKTLISHNFYSEKEFWQIWNQKNYLPLKNKTDPKNIFRDLYRKTHNK